MTEGSEPSDAAGETDMTFALDHVHVYTLDADAAAEWFARHLGAKIVRSRQSDGKARVDVQFGSVFLYLSKPAEGASPRGSALGRGAGIDHLGFSVSDVDRTVAKLRASGVAVTQEPTSPRPGARAAFIEGPDGIRIEIFRRDASDYNDP